MDILYINLADQTDRRHALESNFQAVQAPQWSLHRVDAVPARAAAPVPGRLRDGEKACFQSHIKAIETSKQSDGPVLIAEDDILFGAGSFAAIESALALIPEDSWDLIFTDICITNVHAMLDLLTLRRRAAAEPFRLINLARLPFAAATAYIVGRNAKEKLLGVVSRNGPRDVPYDVYLQQAIHDGKLRAFVVFPFATGLAPSAENSQVRQSQSVQEAAMNAFRRLIWLERDIGTATATLDAVRLRPDDQETAAFLKILAVFLSPQLTPK
jgi:GR25 family glycosyltransferase involved in LPS biosynthesis